MPSKTAPFITAIDRYIFRQVLMPMLAVFVITVPRLALASVEASN